MGCLKLIAQIICKFRRKTLIFASQKMVNVAQLVRASDCGSEGRRFEPGLSPQSRAVTTVTAFFISMGP